MRREFNQSWGVQISQSRGDRLANIREQISQLWVDRPANLDRTDHQSRGSRQSIMRDTYSNHEGTDKPIKEISRNLVLWKFSFSWKFSWKSKLFAKILVSKHFRRNVNKNFRFHKHFLKYLESLQKYTFSKHCHVLAVLSSLSYPGKLSRRLVHSCLSRLSCLSYPVPDVLS